MYNVYINHYKLGSTVRDEEILMFSIPSAAKKPVSKPMVKSSEDSADNFSFSMDSNSPYYNAIIPLKTTFRVTYDGDDIFYGTALAPSTSSVFQTKSVICEGVFNYFNDTYYEGKQEKYRKKMTISDYLNKIISNHNTMAPTKQISRGTVGVNLPSKQDKYEPTSWSQTSSLISNLSSNYGGHMRARYSSGTIYLDWYKYYVRDLGTGLRPKVTIGKNVLDISSDNGIDKIFTRVIPIGDTNNDGKTIYLDGYKYTDKNGTQHTYSGKSMPVSFVREIYTDQQLTDEFRSYTEWRDAETNFGIIYRTMSFSDANTQAKLFNEVTKWLKEGYFGIASSFTVRAVDMHIVDNSQPKILLGDCVDVTYKIGYNWVTKKLVCMAVQYDLFNPENNSYTFGIPSDLLEYDRNNRKKSSKKTSSNTTAPSRPVPHGDEDLDLTFRKVYNTISGRSDNDPDYDARFDGTNPGESFWNNGEIHGTKTCYDPDDVVDGDGNTIGNDPRAHKDKWFTADIIGKITGLGNPCYFVAVSAERGIFAYQDIGDPAPVKHWYVKKKGYNYQAGEAGSSSFETYAKLIEDDDDSTYGGTTNANAFRQNGRINGSAKCFDYDKSHDTNIPEYSSSSGYSVGDVVRYNNYAWRCIVAISSSGEAWNSAHWTQEFVFTAEIVGKFFSNNTQIYVATSNEFGIFAYHRTARAGAINRVRHWYMQAQGITYDNVNNLVHTDNGNVTGTSDGTPDGNPTISFMPTTLSFPEYDPTKTYAVGAMVTHNYNNKPYIWKCIVAIVVPEEWNSNHWERYGASGQGQVLIGYDATATSGNNWQVQLNTPIAYTDADGNTQIVSGVVSANDFHVEEIPSFKTKIGIFDIVIAGKVQAETISADLATIRRMFSGYMAGISIAAQTVDTGDSGSVYTNHLYYKATGMSPIDVMGKIIQTYSFVPSTGKIELKGYPMNSVSQDVLAGVAFQFTSSAGTIYLQGKNSESQSAQWVNLANFNIADTQFYKDAISAAWNSGGETAFFTATRTGPLNPGESSILQAFYLQDPSGFPVPSTMTGIGRYSYLTISARSLNLQTRGPIAPTTSDQNITASNLDYDGLEKVIIAGDSDLVAGNIKDGVTIFGVTGEYAPSLQVRGPIAPSTADKDITPTGNYYGLSKVIISGDEDLVAGNIKKNVTIFGVTGTYEGTTPTFDSSNIDLDQQEVAASNPGGTRLTAIKSAISGAMSAHQYVKFRVRIRKDGSTLATKIYYFSYNPDDPDP